MAGYREPNHRVLLIAGVRLSHSNRSRGTLPVTLRVRKWDLLFSPAGTVLTRHGDSDWKHTALLWRTPWILALRR
jgi:hypothetical protein